MGDQKRTQLQKSRNSGDFAKEIRDEREVEMEAVKDGSVFGRGG
jgi:hypothetical protein